MPTEQTQQTIDESGGLTRHRIYRGVSHRRGMRDKGGAGCTQCFAGNTFHLITSLQCS